MDKKCPIYNTMQFIGKRWTLLILVEMNKGRKKWKRYSEIKRKLMNITPKIMSERLKELKATDMIKKRIDASSFPIKSEYRLTAKGEDFIKVSKEIKKWALKWKLKNSHCETPNCKHCDM